MAYRKLERPYTRFSKYKTLNYIKAKPHCKVVRFDMGTQRKKYSRIIHLVTESAVQIRDNALESARQTCNRVFEADIGKENYYFQVRAYPHHVLRENPLATGAGADRMSTGMAHSFGKSIGVAAQTWKGKRLMTLYVNDEHFRLAKQALNKARYKLPCACKIVVEK